jgi:integrase/recombinase XerD
MNHATPLLNFPRLRTEAPAGPLGPYLEGFLDYLAPVGYRRGSLANLMRGALQYSRVLAQLGLTDVGSLTDQHVRDFVASTPVQLIRGKYPTHNSQAARAAPRMLSYLRTIGVVPPALPPPAPPWAPLLEEWLSFLRLHRGLTEGSLANRRRCIGRFLDALGGNGTVERFENVTHEQVRAYLCTDAPRHTRAERKAVVSMLRQFLGFTLERGYLKQDLRLAIEPVPSFQHEQLPRGPRWDDALRLLKTPDRSSAQGRRDYAILLLLLSYGVRASQITRLTLDDIAWRSRVIHFLPVKGGRAIEVPLLPAVGEALLEYIKRGRPQITERRIFLRLLAPVRPLEAGGITHIVDRSFHLAGVATPHWGSHSLRHAWATQMLHEGRSLKTISDLLGHRQLNTTRIYAKVDFLQLAQVPLPWPVDTAVEEVIP